MKRRILVVQSGGVAWRRRRTRRESVGGESRGKIMRVCGLEL